MSVDYFMKNTYTIDAQIEDRSVPFSEIQAGEYFVKLQGNVDPDATLGIHCDNPLSFPSVDLGQQKSAVVNNGRSLLLFRCEVESIAVRLETCKS